MQFASLGSGSKGNATLVRLVIRWLCTADSPCVKPSDAWRAWAWRRRSWMRHGLPRTRGPQYCKCRPVAQVPDTGVPDSWHLPHGRRETRSARSIAKTASLSKTCQSSPLRCRTMRRSRASTGGDHPGYTHPSWQYHTACGCQFPHLSYSSCWSSITTFPCCWMVLIRPTRRAGGDWGHLKQPAGRGVVAADQSHDTAPPGGGARQREKYSRERARDASLLYWIPWTG